MPFKAYSKTYLQHTGFVKACLRTRKHLWMCQNTEIKILLKLNQNHSTYEFRDSLGRQFTNSAVSDSSPTI